MNAIQESDITRGWRAMSHAIARPKAVLCISAHWYTVDSRILSMRKPRTLHDFYGFPRDLYAVSYPAPGDPELVDAVQDLLGGTVVADSSWGLDHGTWSVLRHFYPEADIPVVQLSIDAHASTHELFKIGTLLRPLREQGILIIGSGDVVHNLALLNMGATEGFPWAIEFDGYIADHILNHRFAMVADYQDAGASAQKAFTTREHFDPLLYVLGAATDADAVQVFNRVFFGGSVSMTSYLFSS